MNTPRWSDLSPGMRAVIIGGASLDIGLRAVALADLARRPADQVRGNKAAWGTALGLVSSAGVLPLVYLLRGRSSTR